MTTPQTASDRQTRATAAPRDSAAPLLQKFGELPAPVRWGAAVLGALLAVRVLRGWRVWLPLAVQVWAATRARP